MISQITTVLANTNSVLKTLSFKLLNQIAITFDRSQKKLYSINSEDYSLITVYRELVLVTWTWNDAHENYDTNCEIDNVRDSEYDSWDW